MSNSIFFWCQWCKSVLLLNFQGTVFFLVWVFYGHFPKIRKIIDEFQKGDKQIMFWSITSLKLFLKYSKYLMFCLIIYTIFRTPWMFFTLLHTFFWSISICIWSNCGSCFFPLRTMLLSGFFTLMVLSLLFT